MLLDEARGSRRTPSPLPVGEGLDVEAVDDGVLPPQVARSASVSCRASASWGRTCSPNASMNALLLLADVVQVDLVEAELGDSASRSACAPRSAEMWTTCVARRSGGTCSATASNVAGGVEVPADRRREDVAAPLLVRDRLGLASSGAQRQVDLQCEVAPRRPRRGRRRSSGAASRCGCVTVISPSAHVRAPRGRRLADRGADQRRRGRRPGPQPGPVDRDQPVVGDLLAAQQGADDVDALAQPGVAHVLARPAVAGDVLVGRPRRCRAPPRTGPGTSSPASRWPGR